MNKKIIHLTCLLALFYCCGYAQNVSYKSLSLDDCIKLALENNLDLKRSELSAKSSDVNYKQSRNGLLPNLNMSYDLGINNGRSIDPFTNAYSNQELTFSNAGLSLDATIFNGFRILNKIKQDRFNLLASEMEIEEAKQNLILDVSLRYIQILSSRDQLVISKARLETTRKQLKRLEVFYKEEFGNLADYTDMQGQYASDQIGIINAENNYKSAILSLIQLLNLDTDSNKTFENIFGLIASEKYLFSADDIYNDALQNLATFKSKQLRIDAANTGIKVARTNYFPEVSLFGRLNTNYSSLAQVFNNTGSVISETGDFVNIGNQEYPVLQNESTFESNKISYEDQFNNNLSSVVGVSVRIPLFNGFQAKNTVSLQKIALEETKVELKNTKLLFKQTIEDAYNNMESAFERFHILQDQVVALEESFRINEVRFNNGVSNIIAYLTSKNNLDSAKLNLNNTKYEYLLRVKILDYYRGV
ncbi:TolC family protein [Flavivirga aquimarina]|uniref:TolC family protein n=1 Tax=Flavivirga aquimarina TaxID=2027862 RepID=A0ABT8WCT1_9FLAO|nr:TolC family protein [Flavivirga aquimarina]MDO5970853.1 TolC family protein [Flavivirga aquimarina]